ncbi:MAG: hypothetical protein C0478_01425 [Planctomyces sp.]|nr:hypothetical protein [Planctomyces sp.]
MLQPALVDAGPPLVAETPPNTAIIQQTKFHLPPGFTIQLVASEPLIGQPMNLNFDAQGRLWVSNSIEYPYPAKSAGVEPRSGHLQGASEHAPRDSVTILTDFSSDGRAGRAWQALGGLNIPIGVLPVDRDVVSYSIPDIVRAEDLDGDGRFETSRRLVGAFGNQDTHGMTNGFTRWLDGWIYACHGFANTSRLTDAAGHPLTLNSGNTFRFRPDGSQLEQYTWGQVNPFGLTFDSWGNFYTADCHSMPLTCLIPGAVYTSFSKPHDGLGFGPTMITHDHGSTGICGPAWYEAHQFPEEYRQSIYLCNPVTGIVHRDRIDYEGSSPKVVTQPDFITCDDPWFRPVDLKLGPDGVLYIADFYNSIIGHYEVPLAHPKRDRVHGRVWRVVYTGEGATPLDDPAIDASSLESLLKLLKHPNQTRRLLATHAIVDRYPEAALAPLRAILEENGHSEDAVVSALWAYSRLSKPIIEPALLVKLAKRPEPLVRGHVSRVLGEIATWNDELSALARSLLKDQHPMVARATVQAIARHPQLANVRDLVELAKTVPPTDTHLAHALKIALREHLLQEPIARSVIAEMWDGAAWQTLSAAALGVPRPWSADLLLASWKASTPAGGLPSEQLQHSIKQISPEQLPTVIAAARQSSLADLATQIRSIREIRQALARRGNTISPETTQWAESLLASHLEGVVAGLETGKNPTSSSTRLLGAQDLSTLLEASGSEDLVTRVVSLLRLQGLSAGDRIAASQAVLAVRPETRLQAIVALVAANPSEVALPPTFAEAISEREDVTITAILTNAMQSASARQQAILADTLCTDSSGGQALLVLMEQGRASPLLLSDPSRRQKLRATLAAGEVPRLDKLLATLPDPDLETRRLLAELQQTLGKTTGDAILGKEIFKKNCAACHKLEGEGAVIGPQLAGVGSRGLERLLEDICDPSGNVDAAFRSSILTLVDGRVETGLRLLDEGELVVMANSKGEKRSFPKGEVEEITLTPLSPMPTGFGKSLKPEELAGLIRYLAVSAEKKP